MTDMTNQDVIELLDDLHKKSISHYDKYATGFDGVGYYAQSKRIEAAKKHLQEMDERMGAGFFGKG